MIGIMPHWLRLFDGAHSRALRDGQALFRRGDPVRAMHVVETGAVALERAVPDGAPLVLHIAAEGTLLAEASLFSSFYHCEAVARGEACVRSLPKEAFLNALNDAPDAALGILAELAAELQRQRARVEILQLRRLSDRLDAWLELNVEPEAGGWVRGRGDRRHVVCALPGVGVPTP